MGHGTTIELVLKQGERPLYPLTPSPYLRSLSSRQSLAPLRRSSQAVKRLTSTLESHQCRVDDEKTELRKPSQFCDQGRSGKNVDALQVILIVVMAAQIPNFLEEIREIVELHYHAFAAMMMLHLLLPFLGLTKKESTARRQTLWKGYSSLTQADSQATTSKASFDEDVGDSSYHSGNVHVRTADEGIDEWGHFADFDEAYQADTIIPSVNLPGLSTLEEVAEED